MTVSAPTTSHTGALAADPTGDATPRPARGSRSDYAQLSSRIRSAGLLQRRTGYYVAKFALTWAAFAAGWVAFVLIGASWWQLLTATVLGVLSTQIAFLGHDVGHKQVVRTRRASYLLGVLHGNLAVGLSMGWWLDKHNRHHAHPNHVDLDPDVAPAGPLIHFPEQGADRRGLLGWATRHQAMVFFPITLLEGLNLHVASIRALRSGTVRAQRLEGSLLAVHLTAFVAAPFLVLTPWQALAFIAVHQAVFGLYMGCSFAPNQGHAADHAGRGAGLPAPPGAHLAQRARRSVRGPAARRAELPDRAPPVPEHAAAQPASRPAPGRPVLRGPRDQVHRDRPPHVLRPGAPTPGRRHGRAARSPLMQRRSVPCGRSG
jgi:fatty acid desaturase